MRFYKISKLLNHIKLVKCLPAIICCSFLVCSCAGIKTAGTPGKIKDTNDVEYLIAALSDKNPKIRASAAKKLQKTNDYRAVEPLIRTAEKDEDSYVRFQARNALGKIRDPRAVAPLIAALKNRTDLKSTQLVAGSAAEALGEIKDPRAVEPLIAFFKDNRYYRCLPKPAGDALIKIGRPAVKPLIAALKGSNFHTRREIAIILVKIGRPAVQALIVALTDKDVHVRSRAAYALGEIKDPRAVEPLIITLKEKDPDVRKEAANALGKIGRPAVEPLMAILPDSDLDDRAWAAWALGKIKINRPTIEALLGEEYASAHANYPAIIEKGKKGTEICLIYALARYGDEVMAEKLLNCNNKLLKEFAREWAQEHDYTIHTLPAWGDATTPAWGRH